MALEVITEVGKVGRHERERRHFDDHNSSWSKSSGKARGRRFIHHGHCTQDDAGWRPHAMAIDPQYTENGPDWKSWLRYIPHPKDENRKNEELWPDKSSHLRTYPGSNNCSVFEWTYYTNGYDTGKKCFFDGKHLKSAYGADEVTDVSRFGSRRKESSVDKRNGIWMASSGDKNYQVPEYSENFHRFGSTRPVANFGSAKSERGTNLKKPETFIPLFPLPLIPCEPYTAKEKRRRKEEEVRQVSSLERWAPAPTLQQSLKDFLQPRKP